MDILNVDLNRWRVNIHGICFGYFAILGVDYKIMADLEFFRITNQWYRSGPEPNFTGMKGPPVYDNTMSSSMPSFTFEKQGKTWVSKYSIPTALKPILSQSLMCSQCNAPDRGDKQRRTPKQATHLYIINLGRSFRPVCGDCQNLSAFDHSVCLDECIPFKDLVHK